MPIAHPYVTLTVNLNPNPLTKYNNHDIIRSTCKKTFCSYNKQKYDHTFICIIVKDPDGRKP